MDHRTKSMSVGASNAPAHVLEHVFLGSKAHAKDKDLLKELQITHVLNVTPPKKQDPLAGVPNFFEREKAFVYRRCAVFDNKAEDLTSVLEGCIAFIEQARFHGRILVHCKQGVSRSVSIVLAYLIKMNELSYDEALALVKKKRPIAQPNASFEAQLRAYADRMQRLRKRKKQQQEQQSRRRQQEEDQSPHKRHVAQDSVRKESIGPQLPPHLRKAGIQDANIFSDAEVSETNANHETGKNAHESHLNQGPVIGATMPPDFKRKLADTDRNAGEEPTTPPVIGPSLPPSAKRQKKQ